VFVQIQENKLGWGTPQATRQFDVGHTAADQAEIGAGCPDIEMVLEPCHRMSVGIIAIAKTVFANFSEVGDAKTRIRLWIKTPHE
jgi:hypothetical protein